MEISKKDNMRGLEIAALMGEHESGDKIHLIDDERQLAIKPHEIGSDTGAFVENEQNYFSAGVYHSL